MPNKHNQQINPGTKILGNLAQQYLNTLSLWKVKRLAGAVTQQKLNYNRVLGKILFVDRQGKPTPLESPQTIDKVIIANDTFRFFNNSFLEKMTHFSRMNLYVKETIGYIEKDKTNPTGAPVISIDKKTPYSVDKPQEAQGVEESSLFKFITNYYLEDATGNFYDANKRNLNDLLPGYKKELKSYFHEHSVNFNNRQSITELLQYVENLRSI